MMVPIRAPRPRNGLASNVSSPVTLRRVSDRLSERDWAILRSVAEHKFLTTRQIADLYFADHAPAACERIARRTVDTAALSTTAWSA